MSSCHTYFHLFHLVITECESAEHRHFKHPSICRGRRSPYVHLHIGRDVAYRLHTCNRDFLRVKPQMHTDLVAHLAENPARAVHVYKYQFPVKFGMAVKPCLAIHTEKFDITISRRISNGIGGRLFPHVWEYGIIATLRLVGIPCHLVTADRKAVAVVVVVNAVRGSGGIEDACPSHTASSAQNGPVGRICDGRLCLRMVAVRVVAYAYPLAFVVLCLRACDCSDTCGAVIV